MKSLYLLVVILYSKLIENPVLLHLCFVELCMYVVSLHICVLFDVLSRNTPLGSVHLNSAPLALARMHPTRLRPTTATLVVVHSYLESRLLRVKARHHVALPGNIN